MRLSSRRSLCPPFDLPHQQTRISPDADFLTLERTLARQGGHLLVSTLRHLAERQRLAVPQPDDMGATHARKLTREDARVEWEQKTAEEVCRLQRAIGHQVRPAPSGVFFWRDIH